MRRLIRQEKAAAWGLLGIWKGKPIKFQRAWAGLQCCCCTTEARLRHNNDISQYNEYTLVLRYNILLCPSRAEDVQHSKEAMQRVRSGIEGRQDQEESGIVVHSAARHRSMLCRSTTYRARSGTHHAPAHHQSGDLDRGIGKNWLTRQGSRLGVPSPSPDLADEPREGQRVLSVLVRVPVEEQGLQEMLDPVERG